MTNTFLQYQLSQLCQNAIETCPFTNPTAGEDCTNKFCSGFPAYIGVGTCVSLGYDPDNCCGSSDPTACLENFAHGGSGGGGSSGTGSANVCASVISILETCFTQNPALSPSAAVPTNGPSATALASCACYDTDGTYDPDQFDTYASACQASGSAAHPTYFPIVTPLVGFCTNNAGAAGPGSAVASTTVPAGAASTSNKAGSGTADTGASAMPTSSGQITAAATTGGSMGTTPSSTSSSTAQTTTTKSGGVKVTIRKSVVLLLGFCVLSSLY